MKARLLILCVILVVVSACAGATPTPGLVPNSPSYSEGKISFPRTVKDDRGNAVAIDHEPFKIYSATLVTDEILLDLVNPTHLVAVTASAADPTQSNVVQLASRVTNQIAKIDPQLIIATKPDLVFIPADTDPATIKQLTDAKLPVFLVNKSNSIKDVESTIQLVGNAVGQGFQASLDVLQMEAKFQVINQVVKDSKPVSVLYYAPDGRSAGPGSLIDEIITRAGGVNAVTAGGIKDAAPQLTDDQVVKLNPDFILLAGHNSFAPGFVDNFAKNPKFQTLGALQNRHTFVANDAHLASTSQYVVEGAADIASLIHPDVYDAGKVKTMYATQVALTNPTPAP